MPLVSKSFSDIITFTRASSGTYFDATGTLQTATTDNARFDYNPSTLAARGMLVEEQRTNGIRNNTMQGAVAGTPGTLPTNWLQAGLGTLTRQIVGTGTDGGITYIDIRYSGTTSTTTYALLPESLTQIVAASGQAWASTFYLKVQAGSTTNITSISNEIRGYDAGGIIQESNSAAVSLTSNLSRNEHIYTLANAGSVRVVNALLFNFASGVAIDITLRIGLPQLEQGAFATSVISTTTAAATRSADVATVNTLSPWYNASAGTLYAEWITAANDSTNNRGIASVDDGSNNNRVAIFIPNSFTPLEVASRIVSGGTATNPTNTGSIALTSTAKTALAYGVGTNQAALCVNGAAPTTASPAATPVSVSVLRIGAIFGITQIGGYIRRITYYPRRLSNAELQGITT